MVKKKKTTKKKATKKVASMTGKKAPAFSLPNHAGDKVSLSQFKSKSHVVLYFYPKDMTPGCTTEAEDFQKQLAKFKRLKIEVIGVSPDSPERHQKFMDKHGLKFHQVQA